MRRFLLRLLSTLRLGRAEADLAREIDAHLQMLEDKHVADGLSREEARYAARRAFGGVEQVKESQRDARAFRWLAGWPMDLKLGVRMLAKSPGLTAVAVTALAVAIGAGAAYIEFTRDVLYPTLPVADADRIVGIKVRDVQRHAPEYRVMHDLAVWREHARAIEQLGAARPFAPHLITDDGRTDAARAVQISASAFRVIPTAPVLGRTLTDTDERPDAAPVAVIGHDLWTARFNSDPAVTGRLVRIGRVAHTIVGVMPDGFAFPANHNLWTPLTVPAAGVPRGQGPFLTTIFGRLRDGTTAEAAAAELQGLAAGVRVNVVPYLDSNLSDDREGGEAAILYAINLVFVMLLAICGANVATLVFARTLMRESEITVRTALGATRGRIGAQLFAEALVLSLLAAGVGLAVAGFVGRWGKQMWIEAAGEPRPFWWDDNISPQTILYALALAVFAAAIVGLIPAAKATGAGLQGRLREAGAGASTMKLGTLWTGVIVAQAAITVMFLATVVSLGWNAARAQSSLDVTYPRDRFFAASVSRGESGIGAEGAPRSGADALLAVTERLKTQPGVISATYATSVPGTTWEQFLLEFADPELHAEANARKKTDVLWTEGARVGPRFFEAFGLAPVAGRLFTDAEILGGHHVAIVDESFVRTVLGGRNAIGVSVRQPAGESGAPGAWHEIVGVVQDVTVMMRKGPDDAVVYRPAGRDALPTRLVVRTRGAASPMAHTLQAAALAAVPGLRLADAMSLDRVAEHEALPARFFLRVVAVIAAVALLLSTAGIYALVSFTLARRTREIGIRVALGAAPMRIITGVFSKAFMHVGIGVLAGAVPGFFIITSGAEDASGVRAATGIAATVVVCAFVVAVATLACAAPLRRALHIEPTQALRAD